MAWPDGATQLSWWPVVQIDSRRWLLKLREFGVEVRVESADLADAEARARLLATLAELDVSVLCNNAGLGSVGDVVSLDAGSELNQVAVNVTAVAELTYALLPRLVLLGAVVRS